MCPLGGRLPAFFLPPSLICNCLLIETASGLVLVDTGVGAADLRDPKRLGPMSHLLGLRGGLDDTAARQIERLGFSPGDVRHILTTHLDLDHAGGLPEFPGATVHVLARERDAALWPTGLMEHERYRACHFRHHPKWETYDPDEGETWNGFHRVRELRGLPPEILLVSLPGHSPGHAGIAVRTGAGWLLHAGDAFYERGQMSPKRAVTPGMRLFQWAVHSDRRAARRTVERLRELSLGDPAIQVLCAHDAGATLESRA